MNEKTPVTQQPAPPVSEQTEAVLSMRPAVDIFEDETGIAVRADMLGANRDHLDATPLPSRERRISPCPKVWKRSIRMPDWPVSSAAPPSAASSTLIRQIRSEVKRNTPRMSR
jgi:hypothetical protein